MAQDRIQVGQLPLTHEFLSLMLGVRRAGVTVALKALRNEDSFPIGEGKSRSTTARE